LRSCDQWCWWRTTGASDANAIVPPTAGKLREFWLGNDHRRKSARIVAEAETAEESIEAVGAGLGVLLLSAGNAELYPRDDIVYRPVRGLSPSELAVVWRAGDDRRAVRVFVDACAQCLCKPQNAWSAAG
jgi:DNA-binding transcriptional LysR family regulator